MKYLFIYLIIGYQKVLSPERGYIPRILGRSRKTCVFYPSCSEYAKEAFVRHGSLKGLVLTTKRVFSCLPGREPTVDEVPEVFSLRHR